MAEARRPASAPNELGGRGTTTGFELRLERGGAYVQLADQPIAPGLRLEDLALEVPDLKFPFPVGEGSGQFRTRLCDLGRFAVLAAPELVSTAIARVDLGALGIAALEASFRDGFAELSGRIAGGPAFTLAAGLVPDGEVGLSVVFHSPRVYGPAPVAAAVLPHLAARALGGLGLTAEPLQVLLRRALAPRGWKVPRTTAVRLVRAELSAAGARLVWAREALAAEPTGDPELLTALEGARSFRDAEARLAAGDLAGARDRYLACGPAATGHPFAAEQLLSLLLLDDHFHDEVLDLASDWLARRPDFAPALLAQASVRIARGEEGRASQALAALAAAAAARGAHASALAAAEACFALPGADRAQALAAVETALGLRRDHLGALRALRGLAAAAGEREGLLRANRRLVAYSPDEVEKARAHAELGELLLEADPPAARLHLDQALRLFPDDPEALAALARACDAAGEPLRAVRARDRLRELFLARGDSASAAQAALDAGALWEERLSHDENALLRYRDACELVPAATEAHARAARVAERLGRWADAADHHAAVLATVDPAAPGAHALAAATHLALADVAERRLEDPGSAAAHLDAALGLGSDDAGVLRRLAALYRRLDRPAELLGALDRLAPIAPAAERPLLLAEAGALAADRLARPDAAQSRFAAALALDGRCLPALEGLARLAAGRGDASAERDALAKLVPLARDREEEAKLWDRVALASERAGDLAGAVRAVSAARRAGPTLPRIGEALRLARLNGDSAARAALLAEQAAAARAGGDAALAAAAWLERARVLAPTDPNRALAAVAEARAVAPGDPEALRAQADLAEATGDARLALGCLRALLARATEAGGSEPVEPGGARTRAPSPRPSPPLPLPRATDDAGERGTPTGGAPAALEVRAPSPRPSPPLLLPRATDDAGERGTPTGGAPAALEVRAPSPRTPTGGAAAALEVRAARAALLAGEPVAAREHAERAIAAGAPGAAEVLAEVLERTDDGPARAALLARVGRSLEAARLFERLGDPARARAALEEAASDPRTAPNALERLAEVCLAEGDAANGAAALLRLAALRGGPEGARLALRAHAAAPSDEALDAAIACAPDHAPARAARARRRAQIDPAGALADAGAALAGDGLDAADRPELARLAVRLATALGDADAARRHLAAYCAARPDDDAALAELAARHGAAGDEDAFVLALERRVETAAGEAAIEVRLALATCLARRPGRAGDAARLLAEALALDPRTSSTLRAALAPPLDEVLADDERRELCDRLVELGLAALEAGAPGAGLTLRDDLARNVDPDLARAAWTALVSAAAREGDAEGEASALAALVPLLPTGARPAHLLRLAGLARAAGDLPAARAAADEARVLAPRDPAAIALACEIARAQGDGAAVAARLGELVAFRPEDAGALQLERARLLARLGAAADADDAFSAALAALPPELALAREHARLRRTALPARSVAEPVERCADRLDAPAAAAALREAAAVALAAGEPGPALRCARRAYARTRDTLPFAAPLLARILYLQGSRDEALVLHRRLLGSGFRELPPDEVVVLARQLAELAEDAGDRDLAIAALDALLARKPQEADAALRRFRLDPDRARAVRRLAAVAARPASARRRAGLRAAAAEGALRDARDAVLAERLWLEARADAARFPALLAALERTRAAAYREVEGASSAAALAALHDAAAAAQAAGDRDAALTILEEAIATERAHGRLAEAAQDLLQLDALAAADGDFARSAARAREAGVLYRALGDLPSAAEALRQSAASDPTSEETWRLLEEVAIAQGEGSPLLGEVRRELVARAAPGPVRAAARVRLAAALAQGQDHAGAIAALEAAIEEHPEGLRASEALEALFAETGREADRARLMLARADRIADPGARSAVAREAAAILGASAAPEDRSVAADAWARLAREAPADLAAGRAAAELLLALGRREDAIPHLAALVRADPDDEAAARQLADAWADRHRERAELFLGRAARASGAPRALRLREAAKAFFAAGEDARAKDLLRDAFTASPADDGAFFAAIRDAAADPDRLDAVLAARARAVPAEAAGCHRARADALLAFGEVERALDAYRACVAAAPEDAEALASFAAALADTRGDAAAAEADLRLAALAEARAGGVSAALEAASRYRLGLAAWSQGRPADGVPHLERALALAPDDGRAGVAWTALAHGHAAAGHGAAALAAAARRIARARALGLEQERRNAIEAGAELLATFDDGGPDAAAIRQAAAELERSAASATAGAQTPAGDDDVEALARLVEAGPGATGFAEALERLVRRHAARGEHRGVAALEAFRASAESDPTARARAWLASGEALARGGADPEEIRTALELAAEADPDLPEPWEVRAALEARLGDRLGAARAQLSVSIRAEGDRAAHAALEAARLFEEEGLHAEAARAYRAAIVARPGCVPARRVLAEDAFAAGDAAAAADHLVAIPLGELPPEARAEHQRALARALEAAGRREEAEVVWSAEFAMEPGDPEAFAHLGAIALARGGLDAWLALAARHDVALSSAGDTAGRRDLRCARGAIFAEHGRLEAARGAFLAALELDPAHGPSQDALAAIDGRAGDWARIAAELAAEADAAADRAEAAALLLRAARILRDRLGRLPEAAAALQEARVRARLSAAPTAQRVAQEADVLLGELAEAEATTPIPASTSTADVALLDDVPPLDLEDPTVSILRSEADASEGAGRADALARLAVQLERAGDTSGAADARAEAIAADPVGAARAAVAAAAGAPPEAQVRLRRVLADALEARGDLEGAIGALLAAQSAAPGDLGVVEALARLTDAAGRPADALAYWERAAELGPEAARAARLGALAARADALGDRDRAQWLWERTRAADPRDETALVALVRHYAEAGELAPLRAVADRLASVAGSAALDPLAATLGRAHFAAGELETARGWLAAAYRQDPADLTLARDLSRIAEKLGDFDEYVRLGAICNEAIGSYDPLAAAARFRHFAEVAESKLGDRGRAMAFLERAVALVPDDAAARRALLALVAAAPGGGKAVLDRWLEAARERPADPAPLAEVAALCGALAAEAREPHAARLRERSRLAASLAAFAGRAAMPAAPAVPGGLPEALRDRVAAPGAAGPLAGLLRLLAPYLEPLFPADLGRRGATSRDRLTAAAAPALHAALGAASRALRARPHAAFVVDRPGLVAALENTQPPAFVFSRSVAELPPAGLAFVSARALALLDLGWALAGKFAPRDVGILLQLACRFAGGSPPELGLPPQRADAFLAALSRDVPPHVRARAAELCDDATAELAASDPSAVVAAIRQSANRVGLLYAGDPCAALAALAGLDARPASAGAVDPALALALPEVRDLALFALSEPLAELRAAAPEVP